MHKTRTISTEGKLASYFRHAQRFVLKLEFFFLGGNFTILSNSFSFEFEKRQNKNNSLAPAEELATCLSCPLGNAVQNAVIFITSLFVASKAFLRWQNFRPLGY